MIFKFFQKDQEQHDLYRYLQEYDDKHLLRIQSEVNDYLKNENVQHQVPIFEDGMEAKIVLPMTQQNVEKMGEKILIDYIVEERSKKKRSEKVFSKLQAELVIFFTGVLAFCAVVNLLIEGIKAYKGIN